MTDYGKTGLEGELSLSDVLKRRLAVWIHEPSRFMLGQSAIGPNY